MELLFGEGVGVGADESMTYCNTTTLTILINYSEGLHIGVHLRGFLFFFNLNLNFSLFSKDVTYYSFSSCNRQNG